MNFFRRLGLQSAADWVGLTACLFFVCASPALCAKKVGESGGRVSFVSQAVPKPDAVDINAVANRAVLQAFLEQNPDVQIEPFTMPKIGVDSAMDTGTLMAISAGMAPHAIYVNFRQSATYNEHGFLLPLESLLARVLSQNPAVRETDANGHWKEDPSREEISSALAKVKERVPEQTWPVVYRDDLTGRSANKHLWSIPVGNLVGAFFYRKDHFQEVGLDPGQPPNDWDELMEYSRRLHDPARNRHAFAFGPGTTISWYAYPFIVSSDARAMKQNAERHWRAAFDTLGAARGLYFVWRMLKEPFERDGATIIGAASLRSDARMLWRRGQLSMKFGALDEEMLASVNPQLVGIAPVPMSPDGFRGGVVNARMIGVFSESTPEQQLAVMRYIWFLTGEDAKRIRTEIFVDRGYGQFVNPDLLSRFGYDRLLDRVPEGWKEIFREALTDGVPEPYGAGTQFIYRMMSAPINQALERDYLQMSRDDAVNDILRLLEEAADTVDMQALGAIPPEEMRKRRIVATFVITILVTGFSIGLARIWRSFGKQSPSIEWSKHRRNLLWGWALLFPGFGLILFWQYIPLAIGGFSITFMDYKVVMESAWVGVDNFAEILYDPDFWSALWREFYFVALMLGLGFWPPILLALLLQEVPTDFAKYFFRTVFYLPSVLIGIVVMFLWMQLFDPSPSGTLNSMLLSLNKIGSLPATMIKWLLMACWLSLVFVLVYIPIRLKEMPFGVKCCFWAAGIIFMAVTISPIYFAVISGGVGEGVAVLGTLIGRFELEPLRWLQDPALAMLCVVIPSVWASSGPGCIIYLAGLKSVPDELYEAAAIDGAGFWHKVFYIVLPRLKFLMVINLIAAMVAAFKSGADQILVMTGGGPNEATTTLSLSIFYRTFMDLEYGVGTAMAWIMGGILIGFTSYQIKMLSRAEFKASGSKS